MSSEECQRIMQMVVEGKISAEEAVSLIMAFVDGDVKEPNDAEVKFFCFPPWKEASNVV